MVSWWQLDGFGINLVVLGVGADEADEDDAGVVVDLDDESAAVALNVEDDPVVGNDVGGRIVLLDVIGLVASRRGRLLVPSLQCLLDVGVAFESEPTF